MKSEFRDGGEGEKDITYVLELGWLQGIDRHLLNCNYGPTQLCVLRAMN